MYSMSRHFPIEALDPDACLHPSLLLNTRIDSILILDNLHAPPRRIDLHITLHRHRRMSVQPPRHQEAAHGPAPDQHSDGARDEQCRNEEHERDADPEEGEDDSCTKGESDGGQGEGGEEEEGEEGQKKLGDDEGL